MSVITESLAVAAPLYNLGFVIVAIFLFIKLFRTHAKNKDVYVKPWVFLFLAVMVFVAEEVITILRQAGIVTIPLHINGFFELTIISLIIYTLLLQRDFVRQHF